MPLRRVGDRRPVAPLTLLARATAISATAVLLGCGPTQQAEGPDRDDAPAASAAVPTEPTEPTEPSATDPDATDPGGGERREGWRAALAELRVEEPSPRDGYDRDRFGGWIDADSNRCDTRCEVLLREFRQDLDGLATGGWLSLWDGVSSSESSELDIDHTVALAEAWVSGADRWGDERRGQFANDLTLGALHAVTASVNRSKSDRDPSEWQPPDRSSWCTFAADWVITKLRWDLSADPLEFTALTTMLDGCP